MCTEWKVVDSLRVSLAGKDLPHGEGACGRGKIDTVDGALTISPQYPHRTFPIAHGGRDCPPVPDSKRSTPRASSEGAQCGRQRPDRVSSRMVRREGVGKWLGTM